MGLHQLYWAYRRRFITTMQQTVRRQHQAFRVSLNTSAERSQRPFLAYVTLLNSMGAISGILLQHPRRRPLGLSLIGSEATEDGRMIHNQMAPVGQEDIAHWYRLAKPRWHVVDGGQVPAGYQLTVLGGCEVYTNGCGPQGTTWYTDGSRKGNPAGMGGATGDCRAGFTLHCGPLHVIGRVRRRQTPYQAELMGMYVASCLARAGDEVVSDNHGRPPAISTGAAQQVTGTQVVAKPPGGTSGADDSGSPRHTGK